MRIYKQTLIPATAFFIIGCLLSSMLPISGANWREVLEVSGDVEMADYAPPPNPYSQAGTTLSATQTVTGFAEEREDVAVFGIRGEVCVTNGGERPTQGLTILATIEVKQGAGQFKEYVSGPVDVKPMPILAAGQEYCYPFEITFSSTGQDKVKYRNSVNVTILNHSGWLPGGNHCEGPDPCPFGPNPKAEFTLPSKGDALGAQSSMEVYIPVTPTALQSLPDATVTEWLGVDPAPEETPAPVH